MSENDKPNSIVDTTDCFEAISTFKSTKNFLYLIILLCLLTLQAVFWLNKLGYIEGDFCQSEVCAAQTCLISPQQCENCNTTDIPLSPPPVDTAPAKADNTDKDVIVEQAQQAIEQNSTQSDPEASSQESKPEAVAEQTETSKTDILGKFKPKICCMTFLIKLCNYLLIFSSIIYSLILLMSIKVSITGRMGGITHISKAFIFSLYAIIFLLPWQQIFPHILMGAIYTPAELFSGGSITADTSIPMQALFYIRFSGLWLIVFLLFLCAQLRSIKSTKTILRRLGMLQ